MKNICILTNFKEENLYSKGKKSDKISMSGRSVINSFKPKLGKVSKQLVEKIIYDLKTATNIKHRSIGKIATMSSIGLTP